MKVYALLFFNKNYTPPVLLSSGYALGDVSFWARSSTKNAIEVFCRLLALKTEKQNSIVHQGYMCHCITMADGLTCCAATDEEYPVRVIYDVLYQLLHNFREKKFPWKEATIDGTYNNDELELYLPTIQNPTSFDKLTKINQDIDATRDMVISNIDSLISRGDKLDTLDNRVNDLLHEAENFKNQTKELNSCCVLS